MTPNNLKDQYSYEEVTRGANGYPTGIHPVIIADTPAKLKAIAEETKGKIVLLKRRHGHDLWTNTGEFYGNDLTEIPMKDSDFFIITDPESAEQDILEHILGPLDQSDTGIFENLADANRGIIDFDHARVILEGLEMRAQDLIDEVHEGKTLIYLGSTNELIYSVNEKDVRFTEDATDYLLAVEVKLETEEE